MENKGSNVLMERYEVGKLLGQGNFAKVHHARDLKSGQSVAIKVIDKEKALKAGLTDNIKREISVMRRVKHMNVLQLYEVMASKTKIYFVIEYAKGGELFNKVAKGRLKEDAGRRYFRQLIHAVEFCHGKGVYHRDLKPENLLLDGNGVLKVSDFGLSALAAESKSRDGLFRTTCGTPAYVAPEVLYGRGYDGAKADIWSCGVILYVMLAGYLPFHDANTIVMYRKASNADYKLPTWFVPEVRELLSRMLDPNPDTRITISEIMDDPWFRKRSDSQSLNTTTLDAEEGKELGKPTSLNAFDIISHSVGLNLSGLFVDNDQNKESVKFVSLQSASTILSKLEQIATSLKMQVRKRDRGLLILEAEEGERRLLSIDVEIFEFTPFCHLVELQNSSGGSQKQWLIIEQQLREDLKDIVWAWNDNQIQSEC
ncbi:CBL-interacting protein kinase 2 [Linum perenne]